jgi:hypothetical protein
VIVCEPM